MEQLSKILEYVSLRNKLLTPELKEIQERLIEIYETNHLESGVIDRGYYTDFQ
jgi:hypothetical protein